MTNQNGTTQLPPLREFMRALADKHRDKIEATLLRALDAERPFKVCCTKCGHWTVTSIPDIRANLDAINALLDRGHGKPAPTTEAAKPTDVSNLANLSDEQLKALLAE